MQLKAEKRKKQKLHANNMARWKCRTKFKPLQTNFCRILYKLNLSRNNYLSFPDPIRNMFDTGTATDLDYCQRDNVNQPNKKDK